MDTIKDAYSAHLTTAWFTVCLLLGFFANMLYRGIREWWALSRHTAADEKFARELKRERRLKQTIPLLKDFVNIVKGRVSKDCVSCAIVWGYDDDTQIVCYLKPTAVKEAQDAQNGSDVA